MKPSRKAVVAAASGVAALAALVGCSSSPGSDAGSGKVTITIGNRPTTSDADNRAYYDKQVKAFEKANPDITLKPSETVWDASTFQALVAGGNLPDVLSVPFTEPQGLIARKQVADLTDALKQTKLGGQLNPTVLKVAQDSSGHTYGVPITAYSVGLIYNRDLFTKAGLDPSKPPTSREELRAYADKITALGNDVKGYYLPGNCAGCNIFTVGPLMWADGAKIESKGPGDEPLTGDGVKDVLQFTRDMVKAGNVHEGDRSENGETFHLQFGTGKVGMMGTGNFNITLARQQNPGMNFGISLLPGKTAGKSASFIGGDLVVVPKGSKRVADSVNVMKFLLSDEVQVEVYAKALNLTTRSDMVDNKYFKAEPLVQDVAKALTVGQTPYSTTFFEQINSPQGPWLKMLQRAYYSNDNLDTVIADAKKEMKAIAERG